MIGEQKNMEEKEQDSVCVVGLKNLDLDPKPTLIDVELWCQSSASIESESEAATSTESLVALDVPVKKNVSEDQLVFVIVDPWSTGTTLWNELERNGNKVIVVWENGNARSQREGVEAIMHEDDFAQTVAQILEQVGDRSNLRAVLAGSETGVPLAETLANLIGLPTNDLKLGEARRNKYLMGETLRKAGVRAVKQKITNSLLEAKKFVVNELGLEPFNVIVKPNMGAGSDDVFLCKTMEEFEEKFNIVNGKVNSLGIFNDGVLVQEYLNGKEYVVDSVSRDGKHRVAHIWKYAKGEANGRFNVYYGSFPLARNSNVVEDLIAYSQQVLDALEFSNGPSHAEIKMTSSGPCLVEVGARCHGGAGAWLELAEVSWGTQQLKLVREGFSKPKQDATFFKEFPEKLNMFGCVCDMILYEDGVIEELENEEMFKQFASFHEIVYYNKVGDIVIKTVDCNTQPGHFVLMHQSEEQVLQDFEAIHEMMRQKKVVKLRK